MTMRDPYAVLGVAPGAPDTEVKAAWRRLVLESHPDKAQSRGASAVDAAEAATKRINEAYAEVRRRRAQAAGKRSTGTAYDRTAAPPMSAGDAMHRARAALDFAESLVERWQRHVSAVRQSLQDAQRAAQTAIDRGEELAQLRARCAVAKETIEAAAVQEVAVTVLTNGAGQGADASWAKYRDWGLPIARHQVVSSRDALEAALPEVVGSRHVASLGPMARQLGIAGELTFAADPDLFERADCFAFLGSAGWDEALQARLESALSRGDVDLLVGNPDISAPLGGAFSAEPGYWTLRAMQATGVRPHWYGKPYPDAFDLVLARLESTQGRSFDRHRVAMVGDSLHTDILGARAAGLQAVLLTGYGLFSDGGAHDTIRACGIVPDWIVATL